jgi:hypothetical protein
MLFYTLAFFVVDLSFSSLRLASGRDCFPLPPKQKPTLSLNITILRNLLFCISTTHLKHHIRISQIEYRFHSRWNRMESINSTLQPGIITSTIS